jgi:dsRNA-specific ribonuclease
MKKTIITDKDSDDIIIDKIRSTFNFNEDPFNSIDDDLLIMAFTPKCNISHPKYNKIKSKYGICDHQSLEFYGDKIFYSVIMSLLYDFFGLKKTPGFYSKLTSELTNNSLLTDLMINKSACQFVRSNNYDIVYGLKKFHNTCADSLEALIGVMYIHFRTKRVDYTGIIKHWLLKNTPFPFIVKKFLNKQGYNDIPVYVINDRKYLLEMWSTNNKDILRELDFAYSGIIFNDDDTLQHIYKLLNWEYIEQFINGVYNIYGKPNGIDQILGSGENIEEAVQNTFSVLIGRGFIVHMKNIDTFFSDELSNKIQSKYTTPDENEPSLENNRIPKPRSQPLTRPNINSSPSYSSQIHPSPIRSSPSYSSPIRSSPSYSSPIHPSPSYSSPIHPSPSYSSPIVSSSSSYPPLIANLPPVRSSPSYPSTNSTSVNYQSSNRRQRPLNNRSTPVNYRPSSSNN